MSIRDLSDADFGFWRNYAKDMRHCHDKEFMEEIDPDLMRALYRGMRNKKSDIKQFQENARKRENLVTLTKMFTAANTILPNLYNQNPRKIAVPTRGTSPASAALMTAAQNHYMKVNNQKQENQESIMYSFFMGLGWKKVGYHIATEPMGDDPEDRLNFMDKAALGVKSAMGIEPDQTLAKSYPDIVRYESLVNTSESPMNVHIDHKGTLSQFKVINHRVKRNVKQLIEFGNYEDEVLQEIVEKFRTRNGTRFDLREMDVDVNEMMIEMRNGIWILAFIDQYEKPIRYDRMSHEGEIPWCPLSLTHEPGVRYPISHMRVASGVQEWIDNVTNLQLEIIGKARSQTYINKEVLAYGQEDALKKNRIGGIVFGKRTLSAGDIAEITSRGVTADTFNMLSLFQSNIQEILGADSQRISGSSQNNTATQDQLANIGTQIRESGMIDRVRDWMIQQSKLEGQFLKQYSNAELHLQITGKDFADPATGRKIEDQWVSYMTLDNPLPLRHYLEGEFDYKINIYEAIKPDKSKLRAELLEAMNILAPLQPTLIQQGGRVRLVELAKQIGETFELINGNDFIETLDPRQQAALQALQVLQNNNGVVPQELGGSTQEVQQSPMENQTVEQV